MARSASSDSGASSDAGSSSSSPSPPPVVEALSAGRSRRATAGNRMRELIEQERERMLAEGDDGEGGENGGDKRKPAPRKGNEDDDENAIFGLDDRAEVEDVDFQECDDVEDIIDSDFDLSSDQGGDDDEEAGERALEEEERLAKKASRAAAAQKTKAIGGPRRPTQATSKAVNVSQPSARKAATVDAQGAAEKQRASRRTATMQVAETVQARLQEDEKRRARLMQQAAPKRKKVEISQADYIAEALEMEERNRESLKKFFEREEERRERDRKGKKARMQGPFIRWQSVTVDRTNGEQRHLIEIHDEKTGKKKSTQAITLDPVFAAREAALEAKRARQEAEAERQKRASAEEREEQEDKKKEEGKTSAVTTEQQSNLLTSGAEDEEQQNATSAPKEQPEEKSQATVEVNDGVVAVKEAEEGAKKEAEEQPVKAGWEARAYVSLHDLPPSTPWPTTFGHILGSHVDWSSYPIVPARNRPLRPRQSVCPITGWPARYRDPRSGIPFANVEAYKTMTQVMDGVYRWSGTGSEDVAQFSPNDSYTNKATTSLSGRRSLGSSSGPSLSTRYDPLEMGCYIDSLEERGANDVLFLARPSETTTATGRASNKGRPVGPALVGTADGYIPRGAIAPGDEKAVIAAANALPAGSTRSGGRRSAAG